MTTATHDAPVYKLIPIADIRTSPQNPRKKMRGIDELTESVKAKGVLHPLLVRPVGATQVEIVAGERRYTAAGRAGLEALPCIVREMDAATALELALVENLERNDLTPLEEGRAFEMLMRAYKRTAEQVASRVGRSVQYVRQRLRLATHLAPELAKLVESDRLDVGAALLLAQCTDKTQKQAATDFARIETTERITRADVATFVERFERDLSSAPFHTGDEKLVPAAGSCTACPKHTGRQGVLFDAADHADMCLDEECWSAKAHAAWEHRAEDSKKRGLRVLTAKEAAAILTHGQPTYDSGFVDVERVWWTGSQNQPAGQLVPDAPRTVGFCADTLRPVEMVPRAEVDKAAKIAMRDASKAASASTPASSKSKGESGKASEADDAAARERKAADARKALNERTLRITLAQAAGAVGTGRVSLERALRALVASYAAGDVEAARVVAKRRMLEVGTASKGVSEDPSVRAVCESASEMDNRQLVGLLAELVARPLIATGPYAVNKSTPPFLVALGIDLPKIVKVAEQELRDEAKAAKATKETRASGVVKRAKSSTPAAKPEEKAAKKPSSKKAKAA